MEKKEPKIKILVACHKADPAIRQDDIYMPIHVGKALHPELDLGFQGDDTGDNISEKNGSYCELTAHYWYWKNCKIDDYVGLCHYRRYFDFGDRLPYGKYQVNLTPQDFGTLEYDNREIFKAMDGVDIILTTPIRYPYSLYTDYCCCHILEDLQVMERVIKDMYPCYSDAFDIIMRHNNKLSHYNMFVMSGDLFRDYSKWLFDILFEVQKRIRISEYPSQARVFGYMAERLLNIYVKGRNLKVREVPIYKVGDESSPPFLRYTLGALRNDICFQLMRHKYSDL